VSATKFHTHTKQQAKLMQSRRQKGGDIPVGVRGVGLVGSECHLPRFHLISYWLIFLPLRSFSPHFKKLNNACLQEEFRQEQHTP
jgi:hypothetical protein